MTEIHYKEKGIVEPTVFRLMVIAVLGSLVIGFLAISYSNFSEGRNERKFQNKTQDLVRIIDSLESQSPGAQMPFKIRIPKDYSLKFENRSIIYEGNSEKSYDTRFRLTEKKLDPGKYHLILKRTIKGIKIINSNHS